MTWIISPTRQLSALAWLALLSGVAALGAEPAGAAAGRVLQKLRTGVCVNFNLVDPYVEVASTERAETLYLDKIPPELRIGQTSRVRLEQGESRKAVLVSRGGFYQSTGGQGIFVVDAQTRIASKRPIKLGRLNPNFYEVLEGLAAGEEVITSGCDSYVAMDRVVLQ